MEEELCYSTVIFNPFDKEKRQSTVTHEEPVLYAEVKRNQSTSHTTSETSAAQCSLKESFLRAQTSLAKEKGVSSSISPAYRRPAVFLGLLCFLLLAALTAVSIFHYIHMSKHNNILAQYNKETAANLQLLADKEVLEQERARLLTQGQQMNSTLDFILHKSIFYVENYCQSTGNWIRCTSCPQNWIQNGSSCYYFHTGQSWNTWTESQEYCKKYGAQLAIIDSVREQEFINQHSEFYYDKYHGYWIGLFENSANTWVWSNGTQLETGFWVEGPYKGYRYCGMSMPSKIPLRSWKSEHCNSKNRWICKMEALTWPNFLQAQRNHNDP
ncbi:C-type lectin domain family 4 member A [Pseudorasbora parva]|uniref:C-type lectin domain family 4 member A n=1 Tax=Pseudorasbora parva TaxID=51549 RepID=UPI00351EE8F8